MMVRVVMTGGSAEGKGHVGDDNGYFVIISDDADHCDADRS